MNQKHLAVKASRPSGPFARVDHPARPARDRYVPRVVQTCRKSFREEPPLEAIDTKTPTTPAFTDLSNIPFRADLAEGSAMGDLRDLRDLRGKKTLPSTRGRT
jgi:hypothetical protein